MNRDLLAAFRNPGSEFRGAPFWSWNGKLTPEELRRQVRVLHEMGLGGFFMHARVGLDTPYLQKEWFDGVSASIDEAKKLGMRAWLYDEDRWPSGSAGGLVTKNPAYRMRELRLKITRKASDLSWSGGVVAAFIARIDGDALDGVERVKQGTTARKLAADESLLIFYVHVHDTTSWFNDQTYLDTMNPDAVGEFIKVTHEGYRKNCGAEFGKSVPGIFTDEPHNGHKCQTIKVGDEEQYATSWTDKLSDTFRQRYGYDLMDHLPELFFDIKGQDLSRARYHYHDCATHLFVTAFAKQIGVWCDKNAMQHTGHMLEEDTLAHQVNMVGSCMRSYEYFQAPGMDLLTEHWRIFATAKQVTSAARQFGRKWRLTETYGCTGWQFDFEGHKALGDWQAALGINLRCQHLSWYTMAGEAKRDYPASIFYQSPWWRDYRKVEDYFARVYAVMTRGEEVRDILMVHPVESMWTLVRRNWKSGEWVGKPDLKATRLDENFLRTTDALLTAHLDFDYGDEEILSRHARIVGKGASLRLVVNQAEYKSVVVPSMRTMRASTLKMLQDFRKAGGQVVFAGDVATHIDAQPSGEVKRFASSCDTAKPETLGKTMAAEGRRVSIVDAKGKEVEPALYLLREDKDAYYLFVANTGQNYFSQSEPDGIQQQKPVATRGLSFPTVRVTLFAETPAIPIEMDTETGTAYAASAKCGKNGWTIETSLPRLGSRVFVFPKKSTGERLTAAPKLKNESSRALAGAWNYGLSDDNAVLLDICRYRIGGGAWKEDYVLNVDKEIRKALGVRHRGGAMVQPWAREKPVNPPSVKVELEYGFTVKDLPVDGLRLAMEQPGSFSSIRVNDAAVLPDADCGWWVDLSLRCLPVPASALCKGENKIRMTCDYNQNHIGLEHVYLLGRFGTKLVKNKAMVTTLPKQMKLGDWGKQGLRFYGGNVSYQRPLTVRFGARQRVFLQIPEYSGTGVKVSVDGKEAGVIAWEPNEVELTDCLTSGQAATLMIEVLGSRRNSHGPFHCAQVKPNWTGPGEYQAFTNPGYHFWPYGLMASPKIVIKKG